MSTNVKLRIVETNREKMLKNYRPVDGKINCFRDIFWEKHGRPPSDFDIMDACVVSAEELEQYYKRERKRR